MQIEFYLDIQSLKGKLMKSIVTDIKVRGDKEIEHIPSIKDKALRINLNENIYGTFAEIGAGQETVRNFFRAGASSGTIAKAMSAYDKDFSDAIYGKEAKNRYVTQNRLRKMLRYEVALIEERLNRENNPGRKFFSYANTVTTINFDKTLKGHGWVGIRFQLDEKEDYNEIVPMSYQYEYSFNKIEDYEQSGDNNGF